MIEVVELYLLACFRCADGIAGEPLCLVTEKRRSEKSLRKLPQPTAIDRFSMFCVRLWLAVVSARLPALLDSRTLTSVLGRCRCQELIIEPWNYLHAGSRWNQRTDEGHKWKQV